MKGVKKNDNKILPIEHAFLEFLLQNTWSRHNLKEA